MEHPVVVIGAGPIGLAAAAHVQARGLDVVVLEAGSGPGTAVRSWGHVRLFSPWSELVDPTSAELLVSVGWAAPDPATYPTGREWVEQYLAPLADALHSRPGVELLFGHRVTGIARRGRDIVVDAGRDGEPFVVHAATSAGARTLLASAVLDASGTWGLPNPLGADGLPAAGEAEHAERIHYGMPHLTDPAAAARYGGRHVVVAGTGASAQNVLVGLARLAEREPGTRVSWLVRRDAASFGGDAADQLVERGALGRRARLVSESTLVTTLARFRAAAVEADDSGRLRVVADDGRTVDGVDEIVVVTGFRPDTTILSEVRVDLDPALQAPRALAPLIDPNVHSCGTVPPHGAAELAQPEAGLFVVGMKSYGRATSFLTLTGYEQVRSVVAAVAGDHESAARIELVLPETGVCGGSGDFGGQEPAAGGCCGSTGPELVVLGNRPLASR